MKPIGAMRRAYKAPGGGGGGSYPVLLDTTASAFDNIRVISVVMPAAVATGDLLLMAITSSGAPSLVSTPTGWTLLGSQNASGNQCKIFLLYKIAGGTEAGTAVSVDLFPANSRAAQVFRYQAGTYSGAPEAAGSGPSTNFIEYQPPLLTPTGGIGAYAWIALVGGGNAAYSGITATYPYPNGNLESVGGSTLRASLASCWANKTAASETPPKFTFNANSAPAGYTIAIKGA